MDRYKFPQQYLFYMFAETKKYISIKVFKGIVQRRKWRSRFLVGIRINFSYSEQEEFLVCHSM